MDKTKYHFQWKENSVIYLLVALALVFVGQLLGTLLLSVGLGFFAGITGRSTDLEWLSPVAVTALDYLMFLGIWIVSLLWFLKKNNRPLYRGLGTGCSGNRLSLLLLGLLLGFVMNGLCILAAALHGDIYLYYDSVQPLGLLVVFVCVFIQSAAEELVCRGYLYQKLMKRFRIPAVAIVGNAALFSLLHIFNDGVTVLAILNILIIGIFFSLLVYYLDSLWCAFAVHAAWNYTQNILFGLPNSGKVSGFSIFRLDASTAMDSFFYNVGFGVESTGFALVIELVACALLIAYGRKRGKKPTDIWEHPGTLQGEPESRSVEA